MTQMKTALRTLSLTTPKQHNMLISPVACVFSGYEANEGWDGILE